MKSPFDHFIRYYFFVILISFTHIVAQSDTKLLLQEGKQLFWSGEYKKSQKVLNSLIQKDSSIAEAYYFLGYIESRINDQNNKEIPDWTFEQARKISANMEKVRILTVNGVFKEAL